MLFQILSPPMSEVTVATEKLIWSLLPNDPPVLLQRMASKAVVIDFTASRKVQPYPHHRHYLRQYSPLAQWSVLNRIFSLELMGTGSFPVIIVILRKDSSTLNLIG